MKTIFVIVILLFCGLASAETHTVTQKDKKFSTTKLKVKIGDKIVFANKEATIVHNVVSMTPGNEFDLQTQNPQQSSTIEISAPKHKAGKMTVECALHPEMVLEVEIEK